VQDRSSSCCIIGAGPVVPSIARAFKKAGVAYEQLDAACSLAQHEDCALDTTIICGQGTPIAPQAGAACSTRIRPTLDPQPGRR